MKKLWTLLLGALFIFSLFSCTAEIEFNCKKDGNIEVKFTGESGIAFKRLILSAAGVEDGEVAFDTKEIAYELTKNGFSNVKAVTKTGTDLSVTMNDPNKKSVLFTSKLVSGNKKGIDVSLSGAKLLDFYNNSDEQIVQFLDLLLAPVFNDEVMEESEYVEMMASFYGQDAADEIAECNLKISVTDIEGNTRTQLVPITRVLTLNEELNLF